MTKAKFKVLGKYIDELVKPIYPMIEKMEFEYIENIDAFFLKIKLNDSTIDSENMYRKGYDPHYLLVHVKKIFRFFEPNGDFLIATVSETPKGEVFHRTNLERI